MAYESHGRLVALWLERMDIIFQCTYKHRFVLSTAVLYLCRSAEMEAIIFWNTFWSQDAQARQAKYPTPPQGV